MIIHHTIKTATIALMCGLGAWGLSSCDDTVVTEPVDLNYGTNQTTDPAAYQKYLQGLRQYRASDHKQVYAWFANPATEFTGQATHMEALPDSVDVIVLANPAVLCGPTFSEFDKARQDKGQRIVYAVDYEAMAAAYASHVADADATGEPYGRDLHTFMADSLSVALSYLERYGLDGIIAGYDGKSTMHMTPAEVEAYQADQLMFMGAIADFKARNPQLSLDFMGYPQNLIDKAILSDCDRVFLRGGLKATNTGMFTMAVQMAEVDGVPAAKLGMLASCASVDPNDIKTGIFANGTRSVDGLGQWAAANPVGAIGVYNAQDDYYSPETSYYHLRTAIQAVNPAGR